VRDRQPLDTTVVRRARPVRWTARASRLPLDSDPASPWLLLPPEVRDALDLVTSLGPPLADSAFGRPLLGVKCGCNAAFVLRPLAEDGPPLPMVDVEVAGRRGRLERDVLRPLVRGETLTRWAVRSDATSESILWTHDALGAALPALPPHARHWLLPWRRRLMTRSDARGRMPWWSIFRTESARTDLPRVVWADIGRAPRAAVIPAGDRLVALNSCYVVRCPSMADAYALATILNGPMAAAWLNAIAEPARGGFRRYLGWTISLLPLPRDWSAARPALAELGERGCNGDTVAASDLLTAALDAYRVDGERVAPLLTWMTY
jgi:hypothetical protein